ncbi:hypothetical protein Tco_1353129 [Tanacetum coccineum]
MRITGLVYHDLYLNKKALVERENVGFDLTKSYLCPSFVEGHIAKGVELRVADSHTVNHHKDDFMPLETIRRFLGIIGSRSLLSSKGRPSRWRGGLPLSKFFCDVLQYYHVHLSRFNPFSCAKLTTFVVMCKAYGCEPTVELFRGFFNLFPGGQWLTFSKRPKNIFPIFYPKLLLELKVGKADSSLFKTPLYLSIVKNFSPKIIDGLKPSREHGHQRPAIFVCGKEMAFRCFMYAKDDDNLSFLPKEPSPDFGTGSPCVWINNEPPLVGTEPIDVANLKQLAENTTNSKGSPASQEKLVGSSSRATRQNTSPSEADSPFLTISDNKEGLPDLDVELLDLHDWCYARQAVMDNTVNLRARELLKIVEQMKGECKAGYQENLTALESKVASLEVEKAKLEVTEASLRQETETVKHDTAEVVSKVVLYIALEMVYSDELGRLVGELVSSVVFYERCVALEEVAVMKEPFNLVKVKVYRPSYKKEHTKSGNDPTTATFPFLSEFIPDPYTQVEASLSKKPQTLQCPALTRTHVPAPSALSQKATPSSTPMSHLLSPPLET